MAIDDLKIWVDKLANMPQDKSKSAWADTLAKTVDARVTNKLQISGVTGKVTYTFNKTLFAKMLKLATATPSGPAAAKVLVDAWEAAAMASKLVVSPTSYLGSSSPATTWSVVASSSILPPSIVAGKQAFLQILLSATSSSDPKKSKLGPGLYTAFKTMQATVSGTNSSSPATSPLVLPSASIL